MATKAASIPVSDTYLEKLADRAESIYENRLKPLLEPAHNNEFVAIHVESGDYAVASNFRAAKRIMLGRHAVDGKLVVMKIGPEPESDSLAYRTVNSVRKKSRQK